MTVRPSTRCCPSLSLGNDQEILCALGNFCHNETPDKEILSSPALLNCTKSMANLRSRADNVREVSSCARIRLHDCPRNAGGNARE